jgi:hypothetical protein
MKQTPIGQQIKERKWRWISHILFKPHGAVERYALDWNPQGTRRRVRPRTTCKKTIEGELQKARKKQKDYP